MGKIKAVVVILILFSEIFIINGVVAQNNNLLPYIITLSPKINLQKSTVYITPYNSNNVCNHKGLSLNTYLFKNKANGKESNDLYFYEKNNTIYISDYKNNNPRAIINLGYFVFDNSIINYFQKNAKLRLKKEKVNITTFFKENIIKYLKSKNNLSDTIYYKLIIVPLLDNNSKPINKDLRNIIIQCKQKIISRNVFIIWENKSHNILPSFLNDNQYKIADIFNNKLLVNKNIKQNNNDGDKQTNNKLKPLTKQQKESKCLKIIFRGHCEDGLKIRYLISGVDNNYTMEQQKVATIKDKQISIPYGNIPGWVSDFDQLEIQLTPPPGYYITNDGLGDNINLSNYDGLLTFYKTDSVKYMYISDFPQYYIIYIDANSFNDKLKLAKQLRSNLKIISEKKSEFLIYLANSSKPVYYTTKEGYLNIIGRLISQQTEAGIFQPDWETIAKNINIEKLKKLRKKGNVHIQMYLSENVYNINRNRITEIISDNLGDYRWEINIISDYEIKKRIKKKNERGMNINYIHF